MPKPAAPAGIPAVRHAAADAAAPPAPGAGVVRMGSSINIEET